MNAKQFVPSAAIGPIALFGSGETSPAAQRIHHAVMSRLSTPIHAAIIETPAGFEPNSDKVAQDIADYLSHRLQNFQPQSRLVPARKRGTAFTPDNPQLADAVFGANYVFMGPGSPSYAVRQLRNSFVWHSMLAQHRLGAAICFSSAATIAVSKYTLPVYEIYKVGEDLHWKDGLDFFSHFGLSLVITPHWNNNDGGDSLDTSRCYMGQARYAELLAMLPDNPVILGIDENTGVVIDPMSGVCQVVGPGNARILHNGTERQYASGGEFHVRELGDWRLPHGRDGIPDEVWQRAEAFYAAHTQSDPDDDVPHEITELAAARESARENQNWALADELRTSAWEQGWSIIDTPQGAQIERRSDA